MAKTTITGANWSSDYSSPVIPMEGVSGFSIQAKWTDSGSLGGTVSIQGSNDGVEFSPITGNTAVADSSSVLFEVKEPKFIWAKLFFEHSAGNGSADILINTVPK